MGIQLACVSCIFEVYTGWLRAIGQSVWFFMNMELESINGHSTCASYSIFEVYTGWWWAIGQSVWLFMNINKVVLFSRHGSFVVVARIRVRTGEDV
jgi:hypothetical protein